jgi:hypothetical protein
MYGALHHAHTGSYGTRWCDFMVGGVGETDSNRIAQGLIYSQV